MTSFSEFILRAAEDHQVIWYPQTPVRGRTRANGSFATEHEAESIVPFGLTGVLPWATNILGSILWSYSTGISYACCMDFKIPYKRQASSVVWTPISRSTPIAPASHIMPKTIAVVGSTGQQGGAVARACLKAGWNVRGLTRSTSSQAAQTLASEGAEMVTANIDDLDTLIQAFHVRAYKFPELARSS